MEWMKLQYERNVLCVCIPRSLYSCSFFHVTSAIKLVFLFTFFFSFLFPQDTHADSGQAAWGALAPGRPLKKRDERSPHCTTPKVSSHLLSVFLTHSSSKPQIWKRHAGDSLLLCCLRSAVHQCPVAFLSSERTVPHSHSTRAEYTDTSTLIKWLETSTSRSASMRLPPTLPLHLLFNPLVDICYLLTSQTLSLHQNHYIKNSMKNKAC